MADPINIAQDPTVAVAVVTGAGVTRKARGCVAARTGAGVYTITLDPNGQAPNLPQAECVALATPGGNVDCRITVEHTSDSVKTVRTFIGAAGTAADADFCVELRRLLG